MPYKLTCPNCDGIKIRGRLRRQELYCGDCGQVWDSPFLLKPEHLSSRYKLRFEIKYDGHPSENSAHIVRSNREWTVVVRLVSEKRDRVRVYECGVCHQTFADDSDKGGDTNGHNDAMSHYVNVHGTAQIESDG
jgi:ribosomal protein L37AE/L43A